MDYSWPFLENKQEMTNSKARYNKCGLFTCLVMALLFVACLYELICRELRVELGSIEINARHSDVVVDATFIAYNAHMYALGQVSSAELHAGHYFR